MVEAVIDSEYCERCEQECYNKGTGQIIQILHGTVLLFTGFENIEITRGDLVTILVTLKNPLRTAACSIPGKYVQISGEPLDYRPGIITEEDRMGW